MSATSIHHHDQHHDGHHLTNNDQPPTTGAPLPFDLRPKEEDSPLSNNNDNSNNSSNDTVDNSNNSVPSNSNNSSNNNDQEEEAAFPPVPLPPPPLLFDLEDCEDACSLGDGQQDEGNPLSDTTSLPPPSTNNDQGEEEEEEAAMPPVPRPPPLLFDLEDYDEDMESLGAEAADDHEDPFDGHDNFDDDEEEEKKKRSIFEDYATAANKSATDSEKDSTSSPLSPLLRRDAALPPWKTEVERVVLIDDVLDVVVDSPSPPPQAPLLINREARPCSEEDQSPQSPIGPALGRGKQGAVFKASYQGQPVAVKQYDLLLSPDVTPIKMEVLINQMAQEHLPSTQQQRPKEEKEEDGEEKESPVLTPLLLQFKAFRTPSTAFTLSRIMSGDLSQLLTSKLSMVHLRSIAYQLCHGLAMLEAMGIVHRDLKPSNVLFDADTGEVKIADFGCAGRSVDAQANTRPEFVGTLTSMSPERIRNEPYSCNSDVWSLGIVIASLALGEHPLRSMLGDAVFFAGADEKFWPMMELFPLEEKAEKEEEDKSNSSSSYTPFHTKLRAQLLLDSSRRSNEAEQRDFAHLSSFLLESCFNVSPMSRPSAEGLLRHPWFLDDRHPVLSTKSSSFEGFPSLAAFA